MNIIGLAISSAVFVGNLVLFREIWYSPDKFLARGEKYRTQLRNFLGFSYWEQGRVNWPLVKIANIFLLLGSGIGIVVSIGGPINY